MPFSSNTSGIKSKMISIVGNGRSSVTNEIITEMTPMIMKNALIQVDIRGPCALISTH